MTNQVRKVPMLIEATRSANTYGEQMQLLIDSKHELALIQHEVEICGAAFSELSTIAGCLQSMEDYLYGIVREFRNMDRELSTMQMTMPEEVWSTIQNLTELGDLRKGDESSRYHSKYIWSYYTTLDLILEEVWATTGIKAKQAKS